MPYALRSGVSYCEAGGRLVFLDLSRDRYFCLSEADELAFRTLARGDPAGDEGVAERFCWLGLIEPALAVSLTPTNAPPRPNESLLDRPDAPLVGGGLMLRAGAALAAARIRLRSRGVATAISALEAERRRKPVDAAVGIAEVAAAFDRLALLVSPLDQCLPRSLALARMLFKRGFAAQFVIGVQRRPFLAHSWVQSGTLLLNERVDIARAYTPILVIE